MVKKHILKSSNLRYASYLPNRRLLLVRFKGGQAYAYGGVPVATWAGLLSAASAGSYFSRAIKGGGYQFKRIA